MKAELYSWMKNLAVYYIFLTAVMNFIPDEKYARYVRYFTGMLLILLLLSPILALFGIDGSFLSHFREQSRQAEEYLEQEMAGAGQRDYLHQAYEREVGGQIAAWLQQEQVPVVKVRLDLTEETLEIRELVIFVSEEMEERKKEEIAGGLEERYQLRREVLAFVLSEDGEKSVADPAAGGDSAGRDRPSG